MRQPTSALLRPTASASFAALLAALLAVVAFASGGYREEVWPWLALPLLWACILTLARLGPLRPSRAALLALGFLLGWSAWLGASLRWSLAPPQTALEIERNLVYVAFFGALVLLVHSCVEARAVVVAVATAVNGVTVVALAGYLLSPGAADATQGRLLFEPIGYANALGGLAAIALLLQIAAAADRDRRVVAALAAASTVPVATALYLTQSRSSWLAFAVALGIWVARSVPKPRTLDLVYLAVFPAIAVSGAAALELVNPSLSDAAHARRCLLCAAITLACAAAAALRPPVKARAGRPVAGSGLAVSCALGLGAVVAVIHGGVGDRQEYWRVAWRMFVAHPITGAGSGAFAGEWLRLRTVPVSALDAHNLYLETLGEVGLIGLALLVGTLVVPLVVGRARRSPLDAAAFAAYTAFLIHACFEWDWELPGITLPALALAGALLARRSDVDTVLSLGVGRRFVGVLVCLCAAAFVGVSALGHTYVRNAERLVANREWLAADADARRAAAVLPWASEPLVVRGDLRLRTGDAADARTFYLRALRRDGRNWQIWFRVSLASSGRAAVEARRRAAELEPGVRSLSASPLGAR